MTDRETLFPALDRKDVSYDKLVELHDRMLAATRAETMSWERSGESFEWASPRGVVDVSADGIALYDDRGNRLRRFSPPTRGLYDAICGAHDRYAGLVIDRILGELADDFDD